MINFSIFKLLGIFGTTIMLLIFFGGTIVGVGKAIKGGDWKAGLTETGGRFFSLDKILSEEATHLLTEGVKPEKDIYNYIFHIIYSLSILFMIFIIFLLLFRIGNWAMGIRQFSATTDLLLIVCIFAMFFVIEYLYTLLILKTHIIPLEGVFKFIINLPRIVNYSWL